MLTWEEDVQADVLRKRGWSITAVAKHLGRDRKTIRPYLNGDRVPGQRRPAGEDAFAMFEPYLNARFADDRMLRRSCCSTRSPSSAIRGRIRVHPPVATAWVAAGVCGLSGVSGRATIDIPHEPGDETQWGWMELPGAPWLAQGQLAHVLVDTLMFSSQCRAVFAEAEDQPRLIAGLDGVARRLGG